MNTPESENKASDHSPDCACEKCFAEFQEFCRNYNPTADEKLEIAEALRRDLFKRVITLHAQLDQSHILSESWRLKFVEETKLHNEARAQLQAVKEENGQWISVAERLPEPSPETLGREYLVVCTPTGPDCPHGPWVSIRSYGNGHFYDQKVTHWRELPPPPAQSPENPDGKEV